MKNGTFTTNIDFDGFKIGKDKEAQEIVLKYMSDENKESMSSQ